MLVWKEYKKQKMCMKECNFYLLCFQTRTKRKRKNGNETRGVSLALRDFVYQVFFAVGARRNKTWNSMSEKGQNIKQKIDANSYSRTASNEKRKKINNSFPLRLLKVSFLFSGYHTWYGRKNYSATENCSVGYSEQFNEAWSRAPFVCRLLRVSVVL